MLILVSFGWLLLWLRLGLRLLVAVEVVVTDDVGLASTGPLPTPLPLLELSLDVDEAGAEAAIIEADCSTDGGNLKSIRLRG